jgi:NAD(P)-dependent dehydrogenase (short-subunit alcohol dehydrogenase family)
MFQRATAAHAARGDQRDAQPIEHACCRGIDLRGQARLHAAFEHGHAPGVPRCGPCCRSGAGGRRHQCPQGSGQRGPQRLGDPQQWRKQLAARGDVREGEAHEAFAGAARGDVAATTAPAAAPSAPAPSSSRRTPIRRSASSGVIAPIPNLGLSNALRSSLVGWSKTLAREVAKDGITANVIVPGRIATDRIAFLDARKAEREGKTVAEVEAESLAAIPAGRYGRPEEYGDLAAFLASPRAGYITGSVLRVDGGLIANV